MSLLNEGDYAAVIEKHGLGQTEPEKTPYLGLVFRLQGRRLGDGRIVPCPAERRVIRVTPVGAGRPALEAALAVLGLADGEEMPTSPTYKPQTGRRVLVRCRHRVVRDRTAEEWELVAAEASTPLASPTTPDAATAPPVT